MLRRYWLSVALAGVTAAGCGGDDGSGDIGSEDGGGGIVDAGTHDGGAIDGGGDAGGGDAGRLTLQAGTYNVSGVMRLSDGCGLTLEDNSLKTLPVFNTGTKISIGTLYGDTPVNGITWNPSDYGLGSGPYTSATTATLTVNTHQTIDDGCEFDIMRTTLITATGNNQLAIDYTDIETNQNTKCKASEFESTATCTSHYTFNLAM